MGFRLSGFSSTGPGLVRFLKTYSKPSDTFSSLSKIPRSRNFAKTFQILWYVFKTISDLCEDIKPQRQPEMDRACFCCRRLSRRKKKLSTVGHNKRTSGSADGNTLRREASAVRHQRHEVSSTYRRSQSGGHVDHHSGTRTTMMQEVPRPPPTIDEGSWSLWNQTASVCVYEHEPPDMDTKRSAIYVYDENPNADPGELSDTYYSHVEVLAQAPFSPYHITWISPGGSESLTTAVPILGGGGRLKGSFRAISAIPNVSLVSVPAPAPGEWKKNSKNPYHPNFNTPNLSSSTAAETGNDVLSSRDVCINHFRSDANDAKGDVDEELNDDGCGISSSTSSRFASAAGVTRQPQQQQQQQQLLQQQQPHSDDDYSRKSTNGSSRSRDGQVGPPSSLSTHSDVMTGGVAQGLTSYEDGACPYHGHAISDWVYDQPYIVWPPPTLRPPPQSFPIPVASEPLGCRCCDQSVVYSHGVADCDACLQMSSSGSMSMCPMAGSFSDSNHPRRPFGYLSNVDGVCRLSDLSTFLVYDGLDPPSSHDHSDHHHRTTGSSRRHQVGRQSGPHVVRTSISRGRLPPYHESVWNGRCRHVMQLHKSVESSRRCHATKPPQGYVWDDCRVTPSESAAMTSFTMSTSASTVQSAPAAFAGYSQTDRSAPTAFGSRSQTDRSAPTAFGTGNKLEPLASSDDEICLNHNGDQGRSSQGRTAVLKDAECRKQAGQLQALKLAKPVLADEQYWV